jgi:flagellar assembly protein FliH
MTASSNPRNFARFIPSEEVDTVSQWKFGVVGDPKLAAIAAPELAAEIEPDEPVEARLARAWDEGYTAGFAQGEAQATQEGERRLDDFVQNQGVEAAQHLAALVIGLDARLKQAEQDIAQQVLALACDLARQVVRRELATDPQALLPVVREALGMLVMDGKPAAVKLHAADLALLQAPLRAEFAAPSVHFMADAAIARGDCLVESGGTVIDGSLSRRWERAVANLGLASAWQEPAESVVPEPMDDSAP